MNPVIQETLLGLSGKPTRCRNKCLKFNLYLPKDIGTNRLTMVNMAEHLHLGGFQLRCTGIFSVLS